ncbi:MAG: GtrA family protein [Alphaproteobacteria bacterium]|nr:GtrA family protein [Alphaproteobacteria bacterium]
MRNLATQFFKFGIVGVIGFIVDAAVLMFCIKELGLGPYSGRVISFIAAASTTWICNRHFTFKGQGSGHFSVQWAKFVVTSAGGFVFNYGTYAALIASAPLVAEYPVIGVAAGSLAGMFFNFFTAKKLVFK